MGGRGHGEGGKYPNGSQNRRLPQLASLRDYRFMVVSECTSDITNLRDIYDRDVRVFMAGQSSLNTLHTLEYVLQRHPNIESAIILPRPPRCDDRHLNQLSQLGSMELAKALPASPFAHKIFLGNYRDLQPTNAAQEKVLFGRDGIHLSTLAGKNLFTAAVKKSIQPLIDLI